MDDLGTTSRTAMAADLYNDVPPADDGRRGRVRGLWPGLVVVAAGTAAAGFVADHYGAPLTLMALLMGLALNFLGRDERLAPGLVFASRDGLRVGIVLIGAKVTLGQMWSLGPGALAAIVAIVGVTIGVGVLAARRLGFGTAFGTLAGGAVAICGASAALSIATTLGEKRAGQAQLTLVLVGISAASATAMVVYPLLARALGFSDLQAGFLLGASIHDVAQSLGAGYSYSPEAGQIATIVKLTRVALLAPVLALLPLFLRTGEASSKTALVPWFVAGFFGLAAVNSLGWVPPVAGSAAQAVAAALLAGAVTAIAIRSPLPELTAAGPRPLLVIGLATLASLTLGVLAATTLLH